MTRQAEIPKQQQTPVTLRRLRAKRAGAIVCLVTLVLAGLWLTWSVIASRRLQAKVAEIRAHHEPLLPEDFDPPSVPANQNAATYLLRAGASVIPSRWALPSRSGLAPNVYPAFPPAWQQMVRTTMASNRNALQLARKARNYDEVNWGIKFGSPLLGSPGWHQPFLGPLQELAILLGDAALYAHDQGDDVDAIEYVRDLWHEGWALGEKLGMVGRLDGLGTEMMANERLEAIAIDMKVEDDVSEPTPDSRAHPVSRKLLRQLIRERLDEGVSRQQHRDALLVTRMERFEAIRSLRNHATILRPMMDLEAVHALDATDLELRSAEQPTWSAAKAVMTQGPSVSQPRNLVSWVGVDPNPPRYSRRASTFVVEPDEQFALPDLRVIAERRVVALVLAIRLYRADHGDWPPNLGALVPKYLPAVPLDPFGGKDQPIGYVIQQSSKGRSKRPLLYFVDPESPPGQVPSPPEEPRCGWDLFGPFQWRDLSRWTPGQ